MTVEPGQAVVTSAGAYPTFNYHVDGFGGRRVGVPYAGDREVPEALLAAARQEQAPLVYFANPDSPMGFLVGAADVQRLIDGVPDGTLLIVDEAYADTAPATAIPPLDVSNPSVLRMRTFSKAYGMAGVRVGYAIGEAGVIKAFDKVRNHFDVSRVAQAGAIAALGDQPYLQSVVSRIARARRASPRSRRPAASPRCPRPRISSPSIAAETAPMRGACWPPWWRAMCSCACRGSPRWTGASA